MESPTGIYSDVMAYTYLDPRSYDVVTAEAERFGRGRRLFLVVT